MNLSIINGIVVDPANKIFQKADILVKNGKIAKIGKITSHKPRATSHKIIDAKNKHVVPGLIDIHTHLRDPGNEAQETLSSATKAAAMGGFTTIFCMPNTVPVVDSPLVVKYILFETKSSGVVNVFPVGAITKKSEGQELAEIGKMKSAGIVAVSDDGHSVMNSLIMRRALDYCKAFDLTVISHCEDVNLSSGGEMNEGYVSTILGLKGIPNQSEEIMVARDILLAQLTGGKLHIAHISTAGAVNLVRQAKKDGIDVTCETAPHYFTLTEEEVKKSDYNTNTKINPPLRTEKDVNAIIKGLADGTIDCIASDHAPHLEEEKQQEFRLAPFGIIGLETMLPLVITKLVKEKILTLSDALAKMTVNPAKIFKIKKGGISEGDDADITIISLDETKVINKFISKSKNSPFVGMKLSGFASATIVGGHVVIKDGQIIDH